MTKKTPPDRAALSQTRATWLASIIAASALVISLLSLYEAHESRLSTVRDELLVRAHRPMGNQPIQFKESTGGLRLASVEAPWGLLLSNTGNSTISITGYEILQIAGEGGEVFYSGMDGGLFNPESKEPVFLPISIEAGKSVRLMAVVGLRPGKRAYEAISASIPRGASLHTVGSIEKLLASKSIDLYDNPVTPFIDNGNVIGWRVDRQGKEQVFLFKFRTARGASIADVSSWYDMMR